ncbi:hypothetical protein [Bradyrhizobium sp. USDA 10063]
MKHASHRAKASPSQMEAEATRLTGIAPYNDKTRPDAERLLDTPGKLDHCADAQQAAGIFNPLVSTFDHVDGLDDDDVSDLDTAQERAVYREQLKRSEFVEAFNYFAELTKPCEGDALIARARKGLRRLQKGIRGKFERDVTVAAVRSDLARGGMSGWLVRDTLALALSCGVTTVDTYSRSGIAHLRFAAAMARAKATEQPEDETSLRFGPPATYDKRPAFNLERATEGTKFDSDAFRQAVLELPMTAQHDFVVSLQRQATESVLDAADKVEQRLPKLSHYEIEALEIAGRNDATTRRTLAKRSATERKMLLADWLTEATHAAIAGDTAQRAASKTYTTQEHREAVADFLEANKRRSFRQRPCTTLETKVARRRREATQAEQKSRVYAAH